MIDIDTDVFIQKLTEDEIDCICDIIDSFSESDFYVPKFKGKYPMGLEMFCLGKHWNPVDNKYYDKRVDYDNKPVDSIFRINDILSIAAYCSEVAFPYHNPDWDICIVNKYGLNSKLGKHQDNSESQEALKIGHPVVSISIGASCIFTYNNDKEIELNHGNCLIFGGSSRNMYHGVKKILPGNYLYDNTRFNFTLRKY